MIDADQKRLQSALVEFLPLPAGMEPHLRAALERLVKNPGSLIRPTIVLKVGKAYDIAAPRSCELAIALEYFHTASLVFDDLPSMDDAFERRGQPCVHVEFSQSTAMLSALALINRAYFLAWQAVSQAEPDCRSSTLSYLEKYLGIGGLLNGQSMDLQYGASPRSLASTEAVAVGKTVALIRLTLVLPALLGGAPAVELRLLDRIALFWGLSYQIVDDLKDVLQSSSESGKTGSRDLSLNRPNIALVLGVAGAVDRLQRIIKIGDSLARRLIVQRPAMQFLNRLRDDLGQEASQIAEAACTTAIGAAA